MADTEQQDASRVRDPLVDDPAFYRDVLVIAWWWLMEGKVEEAQLSIEFALHGDRPKKPPENKFDDRQVTLFQGDDDEQ